MMKSYMSVILSVMIWGSSLIITKIALTAFSPLFLCLIRFSISFLLMSVLRMMRGVKEKPGKEDRKRIFLTAVVGISLYYALENTALELTSACDASLIAGSYPAITALAGILFFHDRFSMKRSIGIGLAVLGVFILTNPTASESGTGSLTGNLMLIIDGILWAVYNYMIPSIDQNISASTVTYYQTLYGAVFLIPFALIRKPVTGEITGPVILSVLFLAVVCSYMAYLLYNYGLRKVSAGSAAAIMNLMPVTGLVLSAVILHETILPIHLIGGAVILAGVILSSAESSTAIDNGN